MNVNEFIHLYEEAWEDPELGSFDFEHPAWVSPDWPPPSNIDQMIYRFMHDGKLKKHERMQRSLTLVYGFTPKQAEEYLQYYP